MKYSDIQRRDKKPIIKSVRISKDSEEFLTKNNISISKVVDISLRELKHKLRKEVGAWK